MLEKTAATLEPSGLQRVLPIATKSFRSRRQLHTAFWQHGAADVEISNAWQALMHGVFGHSMDPALPDSSSPSSASASASASASEPNYPALRASSFLLDFLYPNGAVALLRRFTPVSADRLEYRNPSSFARVSPRLYSASAQPEQKKAERTGAGASPLPDTTVARSGADDLMLHSGLHSEPVESRVHGGETLDNGLGEGRKHTNELRSLLAGNNPEDADKVWLLYSSLGEQDRQSCLGQTLVFLSKTGRVTDSWKISELFHQIDQSRWDGYAFVAGIEAEMNLQNVQQALGIFVKGLEDTKIEPLFLVQAFDVMLAAALKSTTMDMLHDLWQQYDNMAARWDFTGVTAQLSRVSSVANLAGIVLGLRLSLKKTELKGITALKRLLVRRAVLHAADDQVMPLLRMTDDHLAYEEFIRSCRAHSSVERRQVLITQVYKVYRSLPNSKPGHSVLHTVFTAYTAMTTPRAKFTGLEMLWGDWHTFDGQASRRAYQKFLGVYAAAGNVKKVYKLWPEYVKIHGDANVLEGDDTFAHLLQVHAVRQELPEVERVFNEIESRFRLKPNRICWNILLNAYVKAGDYEGAIATFERISNDVGADRYTFATLMQMAGERGDLGYTVDLYRRARKRGVGTHDQAILGGLVDAYCENELFHEAEDVCVRAAGRGLKEPRMWNKILRHYGLRRNLASINRILALMTDLDVPYNKHTYQELLMGLALCRQSQHALHLLAAAIKDNAFQVDEGHFHTVMGAFIKNGEGDLAVRIHRLMQQCGFGESGESLVALATAFSQWHRLPHKRRKGHSQQTLLTQALRRFYKLYGVKNVKHESRSTEKHISSDKLLRPETLSSNFGRLVYLFTQMKDYVKIDELTNLYRRVAYGSTNPSYPLPIQLLNSIMWAHLSEKNYDALGQTWEAMFSMAQAGSVSAEWSEDLPHTRKVSPRYRYILSDGVKTMQTMFIDQGDTLSLQQLFEAVRKEGFEIDSKNWNLHVQGLVQLHAYAEAFEACEQWLMPNWTGWKFARARENMKNAIPLDLRRKGSSPRYLRPVTHTLYYLARGYMELDKMSPWSGDARKMMQNIQRDCPRCFRAIESMTRTYSDLEHQIIGNGPLVEDVDKAEEELESKPEEEVRQTDGHL
ncbi:hypothetical protein JX266_008168 [Neoarthrinium moseri]|nr:hypothetical protein JX266_008168 [Neoarthrinium moseri]